MDTSQQRNANPLAPERSSGSTLRRRQVSGGDDLSVKTPLSKKCPCGKCPVVDPDLLFRGDGSESILRMDNPLSQCGESAVRAIGRRVACQYHLTRLSKLFERAAFLVYDASWYNEVALAELSDGATQGNGQLQQASSSRTASSLARPTSSDLEITRLDFPTEQANASQSGSHVEQISRREQDGLTEDEALALDIEPKLGFWDQPWPFRTTCYMLFTAAVVQGWNQTSTNGANVCWLDDLIRDPSTSLDTYELNDFGCIKGVGYDMKYGVISAAPFLFGFVGCWAADPLNELLMGRRRAILVSTTFIFGSAIASTIVDRWWKLLICRVFLGIGMGGKAAVVPVFLAEIAPAHIRGATIMNWQVFDACGIALGFTANLLASLANPRTAWRWQVASSIIPAFALLIGLVLVSWDSPRFEMKHENQMFGSFCDKENAWKERQKKAAPKRTPEHLSPQETIQHDEVAAPEIGTTAEHTMEPPSLPLRIMDAIRYLYGPHPGFPYHSKAFDTLVILRGNMLLAAKELVYTHCQLIVQQLSLEGKSDANDVDFSIHSLGYWRRLRDLFKKETYLSRELTAAVIVMIAQQTCGINILVFYSARLFTSPNPDPDAVHRVPVLLSWAIGLVNAVCAIPAYWWIQSRGRRWLVLNTMPLLSMMLALAAGSFYFTNESARKGTVAACTLIFTTIYSPGLGPVPFTLSAELFPLEYRMVGMSLVVSINFLIGGIFTLLVPLVPLKDESILLGVFAIANSLVWFLVHRYVREPEVQPSTEGSASNAVGLEAVFQIYQPEHSKHYDFLMNQKWDAVRIIRDSIRRLFLRKRRQQNLLRGRQYFLDWYEDLTSAEVPEMSDHEMTELSA